MNSVFKFSKLPFLLPALVFVIHLSAYCQTQSNSPDNSRERFVLVGNHKLFVRETGDSNARVTVIFESGGGGNSNDWRKVAPLLPGEIRTITYDRAGVGKSEAGPIPQTLAQNAFELHELLEAIKIKGPVILVGQSIAGLILRLYAERYGKNIAGLVLVDPTHESGFLGSLRYGGWVRLREKAVGKPVPVPQTKSTISPGYDSTADYMAEEFQQIYLASLQNPTQLGNRPLIILGAGIRTQPPGTPDEQWKMLRAERDKQTQDLAKLSGNSKFVLDPSSGHAIQNDNPEIVAKSIKEVIDAVIAKSKL